MFTVLACFLHALFDSFTPVSTGGALRRAGPGILLSTFTSFSGLLHALFPCLSHIFSTIAAAMIITAAPGIPLSAFAVLTGFFHALFNCLSPVSAGGALRGARAG
jgi:hypothetical protein